MAKIGWIDFSPAHRARVGTILELLKPEGRVYELGAGIIRDSLADQLFPGISTIQTRAKYFFIIPYILSEYQRLKPSQRNKEIPQKYLEKRENEVMWQLGDIYNHEEGHGVIGITKRKNQKIMRRPSEIYWNGIATFNLIETKSLGMQSFFASRKNSLLESLLALPQGDDFSGDDIDADFDNMFSIRFNCDKNWVENLSLELTPDEAELFRDKILSRVKDTLLCELMANNLLYKEFIAVSSYRDFALRAMIQVIPDKLRRILIMAHDFSELMYGAHITYNCLLQNAKFNSTDFEEDWQEWSNNIETKMIDFKGFNPTELFNVAVTAKSYTRQFILDWWRFINSDKSDINLRNQLVENQEFHNKRGKARLRLRRHDDIRENRWIGLKHLDYRYQNAKTILNDITSSLEN
jgi:hypothetical protein